MPASLTTTANLSDVVAEARRLDSGIRLFRDLFEPYLPVFYYVSRARIKPDERVAEIELSGGRVKQYEYANPSDHWMWVCNSLERPAYLGLKTKAVFEFAETLSTYYLREILDTNNKEQYRVYQDVCRIVDRLLDLAPPHPYVLVIPPRFREARIIDDPQLTWDARPVLESKIFQAKKEIEKIKDFARTPAATQGTPIKTFIMGVDFVR